MTPRQMQQVTECVRRARAEWGDGWARLSSDQRQAYAARQALALFLAQDEDTRGAECFSRLVAVAEAVLAATA